MTDRLIIRFRAQGIPRPQGSKRIVRGRMIESARGHAAWRQTISMAALAARQEISGEWPVTRPVHVDMDFLMHGRPDARPDVDKLARAVLDGIIDAGILRDDSQVVSVFAVKEQARKPEECGVSVSIWEA